MDGNRPEIGRGSDIGFGLLLEASKTKNNKLNNIALLKIVLSYAVTFFMEVKGGFGLQWLVGGVSGSVGIVKSYNDFHNKIRPFLKSNIIFWEFQIV